MHAILAQATDNVVVNPYVGLIAVVVPIVISQLRKYVTKIPKSWYPVVAPVLGALAEIALNYAGVTAGNGLVGALLGSAGVGLREIADQTKKGVKPVQSGPP